MSWPCATARRPEKETCSTVVDQLLHLAFLLDDEPAVGDGELGAGIEKAGEDDLPGPRRDVDEAAGAGRHMRPDAELRDVDRAVAVDLQEGQQRGIEARRPGNR